jgi:hypothetical protein
MTAPKVPEHLIMLQIIDYLNKRGCYVWRNNTGAFIRNYYNMREARWKETFFRSGMKGLPDIIGLDSGGRFIGIEVKTATGKTSPEQVRVLAEMKQRGAWAFVARSLDEVMKVLYSCYNWY